jgi:hypothetical protein
MGLALYMDHHVPRAVTTALRLRGIDVLTAHEDGAARLRDDALLDRATALNRVLFSQDDDLLREAAERQRAGRDFGGVVYAHPLSLSIGTLVRELDLVATAAEVHEIRGLVLFLPL